MAVHGEGYWAVIAAESVRLFLDLWDAEQAMLNDDEKRTPSVCDFAARMNLTVTEAVDVCRNAIEHKMVWMTDPGFLLREAPKLTSD